MGTLSATLLFCAITGQTTDTVLLDFYGTPCGPCKKMEPTVARLQSAGYPVRKINVAEDRTLAQQFRVNTVPCFVLVSGGREVGRINNAVSYDMLVQLFTRVGYRPASVSRRSVRPTAAQLPNGFGYGGAATSAAPRQPSAGVSRANAQVASRSAARLTASNEAQRSAFAASVRIQVQDAKGRSYGTGTIIDMYGDDALVLTCGHIFRTSQGRGSIQVDVFSDGQVKTVPGELITYDAEKNDIALISVRPGFHVEPAPVATSAARPAVGDAVFSVGCDNGADPSLRVSRITAINKYLGPSNFEVAGKPVNGRSGGGLFTSDGSLIGVCNAADDQDNEGIYRGLRTIHQELASIGQQRLFQPEVVPPTIHNDAATPVIAAAANGINRLQGTVSRGQEPAPSAAKDRGWETQANDLIRQVSTTARDAVRTAVATATEQSQVICVVPGSPNNGGQPRIVVVEQPSPQLIKQIESESQPQTRNGFADNQRQRWPNPPMTPVMRAQSQR